MLIKVDAREGREEGILMGAIGAIYVKQVLLRVRMWHRIGMISIAARADDKRS